MSQTTNQPESSTPEIKSTAEASEVKSRGSAHRIIPSLQQWGHQEAGLNRGDQHAFESRLRWIREGHIVDGVHDENDEIKQIERIDKDILQKEQELNTLVHDEKFIKETTIPSKEEQIRKHEDDIDDRRIRIKEGKIKSLFNPARFWLYVLITSLLSIFLIFFYASVMNAAFFRNIQEIMKDPQTVVMKIDSPFDPDALFGGGVKLLFSYLGAFLFFGLGLIPHILMQDKAKKQMWVWIAVFVSLVVDGLMAYKIDKTIHQLKIMMRIPDENWFFLTSSNFYIVLVFGFGAYMLWGFLFEASIQEWQKRDMQANLQIEIEGIRRRIHELKEELNQLRARVNEIQQKIESTKLQIAHLVKSREATQLKPATLLRNMENFYAGWLQYLNSSAEYTDLKTSCDLIFKQFRSEVANQPTV